MNCENYKEMIPEYISGELPDDKMIDFDKHISVCESCRNELFLEKNILKNLSEESYKVPDGLNRSVIENLPKNNSIFSNRYLIYSAAASILLIITLTLTFNFNKNIPIAPAIASITDTVKTSAVQADYASLGYIDQDFQDMVDYDAVLYDKDKWSSDSSEIFSSEDEIVNGLLTLDELESYDDYLSSL